MTKEKPVTSVRIPSDYKERIRKIVQKSLKNTGLPKYPNQSSFIRIAIRKLLEHEETNKEILI